MGPRVGITVWGLLMLATTACGSDAPRPSSAGARDVTPPSVVQIDASEYSYSLPRQVAGGVVTFELSNVGAQPHEFATGRIDSGKTAEDLLKALRSGKDPSNFPWIHPFPGVPILSPGERISITREVNDDGTYVIFCALPTAEGRPHYEQGMIQSVEIRGSSGRELPEPDATIAATDEGFEAPPLSAGRQVLELKNAGTKDHEFWLWAFARGKTNRDVNAWVGRGLEGPAPATFFGAVKSIPPGTSVFLEIDLQSGTTYTMQDFDNRLKARLPIR